MHVSFKDKNSRTLPDHVGPSSIGSSASLNKYPTIEVYLLAPADPTATDATTFSS